MTIPARDIDDERRGPTRLPRKNGPRRKPWDGNVPRDGDARKRLLEAGIECIAEEGVESFELSSVAMRAGVSRPTVYRYFKDRDALFDATVLEALNQRIIPIVKHSRSFDDPAERVLFMTIETIRLMIDDPVLKTMFFKADPHGATRVGSRVTQPFAIDLARQNVPWLFEELGWDEEEAQECIETMNRFVVSLVIAQHPPRDARELRGYLRRRLLPAIGLSPSAD